MAEGVIIAKPGQSMGEAVRQNMQQEALAKQQLKMKEAVSLKIGNVLNALMVNLAVDEDHAVSIALEYVAGLALTTGTAKDKVVQGFDAIWDKQVAAQEAVRAEQRKMLLNIARQIMGEKQPLPKELLQQLQALKAEIPEEIQRWVDEHPAPEPLDANPALVVVPPAAEA